MKKIISLLIFTLFKVIILAENTDLISGKDSKEAVERKKIKEETTQNPIENIKGRLSVGDTMEILGWIRALLSSYDCEYALNCFEKSLDKTVKNPEQFHWYKRVHSFMERYADDAENLFKNASKTSQLLMREIINVKCEDFFESVCKLLIVYQFVFENAPKEAVFFDTPDKLLIEIVAGSSFNTAVPYLLYDLTNLIKNNDYRIQSFGKKYKDEILKNERLALPIDYKKIKDGIAN